MTLTTQDLEEIKQLMDEKFDEKLRNLPSKNEFFEWMDKLMKELKDFRDELTILSHHSSDHSDRIEKLEKIHPRSSHASI